MIRQATLALQRGIPLVCLILLGGIPAAGQEPAGRESSVPAYRIKASDIVVPADVPLGQYRRTIRPFENWTLICDENLEAHQKVCNITQIIEDRTGNTAFSWSLAASEDGKPYFLLRTPPTMRSDGTLSLQFEGRRSPVEVALQGCNEVVCVGMVPVGPILREQIGREANSRISYVTATGETVTVTASLKGLGKALAAIN
ncbi:invasion associated locus B family protein [Starkeya nomas]|nr:invasion associated locus B family protein [Starkeya nomas]